MNKPALIALVFESHVFANEDIMKGVAEFAQQNCDWNFYLDDQAVSIDDPQSLFAIKFDGLICRHINPVVLEECARRKIPCVALDSTAANISNVPAVIGDEKAIGQTGAEYLLSLGYQNFGFCGFSNVEWAQNRQIGFTKIISDAGFNTSILEGLNIPVTVPDWYDRESAAMRKWVDELPKPVAIMACQDLRGLHLIGVIREAGYLIPDDVAVIGADNDRFRTKLCQPPLSSIQFNSTKWGYKVAECLHRQLEGKPVEPLTLLEPLQVVVRGSTDALAIEDEGTLKAMKIIDEQVAELLSVDDLAKLVGLSRSVLEHRFRKFLRKTPQEAIRAAKIARVKILLEQTDLSLAEIAESLKFSHPEYLSVMFKRLCGETASAFRTRHRKSK